MVSHAQPLRVVHLTVYRDLPSGIRKQIKWERSASSKLEGIVWDSVAVHGGTPVEPFETQIPRLLRPMFLRNLFGWLTAWRLSKSYDMVLLRHMPFDPFVFFFAPFIRNRISIHHSREWEEMPLIRPGIKGQLGGAVERVTGWVAVRCAKGILGVTSEIAQFQAAIRAPDKPAGLYANGIDLDSVEEAEDARSDTAVNAVFMSNTFSKWHGLDRLVDAVRNLPDIPNELTIHLIGHLSEAQKQDVMSLGDQAKLFKIHGFLDASAYKALIAQADIGIGSLAMDRQNLTEGSTLKVREMLGMGLPVYSSHIDTALDLDFPFYKFVENVDISSLLAFAHKTKHTTRSEVRAASAPHIEKSAMMQTAGNWLIDLTRQDRRK